VWAFAAMMGLVAIGVVGGMPEETGTPIAGVWFLGICLSATISFLAVGFLLLRRQRLLVTIIFVLSGMGMLCLLAFLAYVPEAQFLSLMWVTQVALGFLMGLLKSR
jgi:hypothetical protein